FETLVRRTHARRNSHPSTPSTRLPVSVSGNPCTPRSVSAARAHPATPRLRAIARPIFRPSAARSVPRRDLLLIAEAELLRPDDLVILVTLARHQQTI